MRISRLLPLCAAALLSTPILAEEGDASRGRIKELEERAHAAKEQGRGDEAKEVMQQVQRLHAEMSERERRHGDSGKLEMAKRRIDELHKAGKHEEAAQLERRLREAGEQRGDAERKESGGDAERREHAKEAIRHLHAAGMHEPAERVEQTLREDSKKPEQGERKHGDKAARSGHEGGSPQEGDERMRRAMGEMQEQVQRAMRDMQEQTQRALRETHEQMAKMARAIEELREQAARPRRDGERGKD
jgi:hypothetical protein